MQNAWYNGIPTVHESGIIIQIQYSKLVVLGILQEILSNYFLSEMSWSWSSARTGQKTCQKIIIIIIKKFQATFVQCSGTHIYFFFFVGQFYFCHLQGFAKLKSISVMRRMSQEHTTMDSRQLMLYYNKSESKTGLEGWNGIQTQTDSERLLNRLKKLYLILICHVMVVAKCCKNRECQPLWVSTI